MKTINFTILLLLLISITQLVSVEKSKDTLNLVIPDSSQVQILTIDDGSTFMGRIIEIGEEEIRFDTKHGIMTFSIFEITEVKLVSDDQIKEGQYWFPNPNSSRLFFAPTGRMVKQGEGYFADYFIFFPTITFGVTDNITLGGGFSILPGMDLDEQALLFTPKVGVKTSKKMDLAIGALVVKLPEDTPSLGILYGVSTFGSLDNSITVGLGYGFFDNKLADKPIVVLGGETRTSRSISLVTENWIVPEKDTPILSFGLRFFGKKLSSDFALIFPLEDEVITFPYIDFVYKF